MSCWASNRASQNPSRPASKATQTRRTTRPPRRDSSRQRSINLNSCSGSGGSFFSGSRASPGARGDQPTRLAHFDDDDQRAILIQGGERLAQIERFGHGALHRGFDSSDGALFSPPAP